MLNFIIIDDEPLAHEVIEEFCNMIPHIQLVGHCYSAMEALKFLNKEKVDFIFLDINMPKLSGLDFLRTLSNPPMVIITSAYKEYAIEGYELNVVDYLLKPIPFDRLVKAVNKISEKQPVSTNQVAKEPKKDTSFFVKGDKKYHQIHAEDILYIEAYGNYTKMYFEEEMILSHEKISFYESSLDERQFMRVHKSYIIAIEKINMVEGNRILIDDHKIPIGQTYKSQVNKLIQR